MCEQNIVEIDRTAIWSPSRSHFHLKNECLSVIPMSIASFALYRREVRLPRRTWHRIWEAVSHRDGSGSWCHRCRSWCSGSKHSTSPSHHSPLLKARLLSSLLYTLQNITITYVCLYTVNSPWNSVDFRLCDVILDRRPRVK